jgi:hypothetical protein
MSKGLNELNAVLARIKEYVYDATPANGAKLLRDLREGLELDLAGAIAQIELELRDAKTDVRSVEKYKQIISIVMSDCMPRG